MEYYVYIPLHVCNIPLCVCMYREIYVSLSSKQAIKGRKSISENLIDLIKSKCNISICQETP